MTSSCALTPSLSDIRLESPYLTPPEAAAYLKISVQTLAVWRCLKRGPKFVLVNTRVRYVREDLDAFVRSCNQPRRASPKAGRPPKKARRGASR